jgi:hypothetical protein
VIKRKEKHNSVGTPGRNQLRELLHANAKALQDEAIRTGGSIPSEQLAALQRLSSLVEISDAAQPPPARSHGPLIAVFASTLLIVSILLFTGLEVQRLSWILK